MARELEGFDRIARNLISVIRTIPSKAATVAVNFTKERFRQQNWLNASAEKWKERKPPKRKTRAERRAILVKTARLMRSIRKLAANSDRAIIGTDVPYAQAHNDGAKIDAVQNVSSHQVRSYTRKAHTRKRAGRTERVPSATVAAHTVKSFRRTMKFQMPQRQFLGNSMVQNGKIEVMMNSEIQKAINLTT